VGPLFAPPPPRAHSRNLSSHHGPIRGNCAPNPVAAPGPLPLPVPSSSPGLPLSGRRGIALFSTPSGGNPVSCSGRPMAVLDVIDGEGAFDSLSAKAWWRLAFQGRDIESPGAAPPFRAARFLLRGWPALPISASTIVATMERLPPPFAPAVREPDPSPMPLRRAAS